MTTVTTAEELTRAAQDGTAEIVVHGTIAGSPMITLQPGTTLRGGTLEFGAKGVRLTRNNTLEDITITTAVDEVAVFNDTTMEDFGTLVLRNVKTRGQVLFLAEGNVRRGHVQVETLNVTAADVRGRSTRPHGFGVEALQGAFTVWNRQTDTGIHITAELLDISAGTKNEPIRGSGVFVGGHGDWNGTADGGTVRVSELRTGEVHTDGGIPAGTPDLISGGVFVITGAIVQKVVNDGSTTTYGQNDMVLDNWGIVDSWTANAPVVSHGPSGIGFVNFGDINTLDVDAPILTTGRGARGFNLYDGTLNAARFSSIATTGDGSVGVQISKPLGTLDIIGDVTTTGGSGMSLVKGVQVNLKAIALSVKDGGVIDRISVGGKLATSGEHVTTLEVAGTVKTFSVAGGIHATGNKSEAVDVAGGKIDLTGIRHSQV